MDKEQYKNEPLLKILVVLAGVVALINQIFALLGYYWWLPIYNYYWIWPFYLVLVLVGIFFTILTILCGLRKEYKKGGEIVPFHWITFLVLGILLLIFGGGVIPLILLIIAFFLALIEEF